MTVCVPEMIKASTVNEERFNVGASYEICCSDTAGTVPPEDLTNKEQTGRTLRRQFRNIDLRCLTASTPDPA